MPKAKNFRNVNGEVDWNKVDPTITYEGEKITLPDTPEKMPLRQAADMLIEKAKDEETQVEVTEIIDAFPTDGAHAFNIAISRTYGWAIGKKIPGFFRDHPPEWRTIETGPNNEDRVQVPWGRFQLPNVSGDFYTMIDRKPNKGLVLKLVAIVAKKDREILKSLARLTREILQEQSIYQGKAIRLISEDGELDVDEPPEFLSTDYINPEELILNPVEEMQVRAALLAPIQNIEACIKQKIPLKRGILLEGPYGTGKTLTANMAAKVAVDNGWTFVLVDHVEHLKEALLFAKRYEPAVVFAEDVDRVASKRDEKGNDLLNTIDGIISKNAKIITVLTTNHVEKLERAMLRPGRLDAVIRINPPEPMQVERLLRLYGGNLIKTEEDLKPAGEALEGRIPAVIREVVERSKLAAIVLGQEFVSCDNIVAMAEGMKRHLDLLADKEPELSADEKLGRAFREALSSGNGVSQEWLQGTDKRLSAIDTRTTRILREVS